MQKKIIYDDILYQPSAVSNRSKDGNNYLNIDNCILSQSIVSDYLGKEIPNYEDLGLKANEVYSVLRDKEEMQKSYRTFDILPLLNMHLSVTPENFKNMPKVGVSHNVNFVGNDLIGSLKIFDANAIKSINDREKTKPMGISCGYTYDPVLENGEFEGEKYVIKMTNIHGNHIALVDNPRVEKAIVPDSASLISSFKKGKNYMWNLLKKYMANDADMTEADFDDALGSILSSDDSVEEKHDKIMTLAKKFKREDDEDDEEKDKDDDSENQTSDRKKRKARDEESDKKDDDKYKKDKQAKDQGLFAGFSTAGIPDYVNQVTPKLTNENPITREEIKSMLKDMLDEYLKDKVSYHTETMDSAIDLAQSVLGYVNRSSFAGKPEKAYEAIIKSVGMSYDGKSVNEKKVMAETIAVTKNAGKQNVYDSAPVVTKFSKEEQESLKRLGVM